MLCDRCRKNEASVHVTQIVNGIKYEQNLCGECAGMQLGNTDGMGGFWGFQFPGILYRLQEMSTVGSAWSETVGNAARGSEAEFEALGLKLPRVPAGQKEEQPAVRADQKERLRGELEEAVKVENYEKAAQLRDKLYLMEQEEKEGK